MTYMGLCYLDLEGRARWARPTEWSVRRGVVGGVCCLSVGLLTIRPCPCLSVSLLRVNLQNPAGFKFALCWDFRVDGI